MSPALASSFELEDNFFSQQYNVLYVFLQYNVLFLLLTAFYFHFFLQSNVFLQYNVLFFTVDSILLPFFSAVQCLFAVQCSFFYCWQHFTSIFFCSPMSFCSTMFYFLLLTAFYFHFFLQSNVYLQYNEDHYIRYCIENSTRLIRSIFRGESRIPRWMGRWPWGGGAAPKYDFAQFSTKKLHEIKKNLGRRGARAGGPPLDPPLILNIKDPSNNLPVQQNTCW